jgi:hypothetical protein
MKLLNYDERLASILIQQGFIERSNTLDQQNGKRLFKHKKNRRFHVEFDFTNFIPFERRQTLPGFFGRPLNAEDLKAFLWYLNLPVSARKRINEGKNFSLNSAKTFYHALVEEFDFYGNTFSKNKSTLKIKRLIDLYKAINLN